MRLSVIVPFKNGENYVDRFIKGYFSQTLDTDLFDVTFVSNISSDDTLLILKKIIKDRDVRNIQILQYDEKPSSYAARNFGVNNTQGDVVVFTDIDCLMDRKFLEIIYKSFCKDQEHALSGNIIIEVEDKKNCWEVYDSLFNMNNEKMLIRHRIATANFALPRSIFYNVGFFQELVSSGDSEYGERLYSNHVSIKYDSNAVVIHPSRKTYQEIEKKLLRIAYGEGQRAAQDKLSIKKMRLVYVLKALNFVHIIRMRNAMKDDIGFIDFFLFSVLFTKIRFKQISAFVNGYNNNKTDIYNK